MLSVTGISNNEITATMNTNGQLEIISLNDITGEKVYYIKHAYNAKMYYNHKKEKITYAFGKGSNGITKAPVMTYNTKDVSYTDFAWGVKTDTVKSGKNELGYIYLYSKTYSNISEAFSYDGKTLSYYTLTGYNDSNGDMLGFSLNWDANYRFGDLLRKSPAYHLVEWYESATIKKYKAYDYPAMFTSWGRGSEVTKFAGTEMSKEDFEKNALWYTPEMSVSGYNDGTKTSVDSTPGINSKFCDAEYTVTKNTTVVSTSNPKIKIIAYRPFMAEGIQTKESTNYITITFITRNCLCTTK